MNTMEKPKCQNCVHFRAERSMRDTLGLAHSMGIANALNSLQQNEQNLRNRERQYQQQLAFQNEEIWPFRPTILSYCGFSENEGEYLVHQVKNAGGRCTDHVDISPSSSRPCESCRHFVKAAGFDQQRVNLRDILNQGTLTGGFEGHSDPSRITGDIDKLMNSSQSEQSGEITEAMYGGGKLSHTPRFFDWCRKYSTDTEYALCRFENHDGRCHGWESSYRSNPSSPSFSSFKREQVNLTGIWVAGDGMPTQFMQQGNQFTFQGANQFGMTVVNGRGVVNGYQVQLSFQYNDGYVYDEATAEMQISSDGRQMQGNVRFMRTSMKFLTFVKQS